MKKQTVLPNPPTPNKQTRRKNTRSDLEIHRGGRPSLKKKKKKVKLVQEGDPGQCTEMVIFYEAIYRVDKTFRLAGPPRTTSEWS